MEHRGRPPEEGPTPDGEVRRRGLPPTPRLGPPSRRRDAAEPFLLNTLDPARRGPAT